MENKTFAVQLYKYLIVLIISISMIGCGGESNDDFTPTSDKLTYTAELYGEKPPGQYLGIRAERSNVELPNIYYNPVIISEFHASVDGSMIDLFIHVVNPLKLGVGHFTSYIDVINSKDHQGVELSYIITDPTSDMLPERRVDNIGPYRVLSNTAREYIIRGKGFSEFGAANPAQISIGDYIVDEYTYIDDTEIRVTLPSLEVGIHNVSVSHSLSEYVSEASLKVIEPFVVGSTAFYIDGPKEEVVFDDSRKTLYVVVNNGVRMDSTLQRYRYNNVGGWSNDSLTINTLTGAGIASDGDTLVLATGDGFAEIDLNDSVLEIKTTIQSPDYIEGVHYYLTNCNNGVMIDSYPLNRSLLAYDVRKKIIYEENRSAYDRFSTPKLVSHENGSQIVIKEYEGNFYTLNCNGFEVIRQGDAPQGGTISATPDQTLFLLNGQDIYNESLKYVSSLPETNSVGVISPEKTRIYTYDNNTTTLRSYDISNLYAPNKVGEISIEPRGISYSAQNMILSRDGNTLFLTTYEGVHIIDLTTTNFENE